MNIGLGWELQGLDRALGGWATHVEFRVSLGGRESPASMESVPARAAQEVVGHSLGQFSTLHFGLSGQPVVDSVAATEDYGA